MKRKNIFTSIIALVMAMTILFTAMPVSAKTTKKTSSASIVVAATVKKAPEAVFLGATLTKEGKAIVKTTNKSAGTVKRKKIGVLYAYYFTPKKAGKTTITLTTKKQIIKRKITVAKYQNPVSVIQIGGNIINGSKYNKTDRMYLKYSAYAGRPHSFRVIPKPGFRLTYLCAKNKAGAEIAYINANDLIYPTGGARNYILEMRFQNMRTNVTYNTEIVFK